MVKVETYGLFHYQVIGDKEEEAAKRLDELVEAWQRLGHTTVEEKIESISRLERDYGVTVKYSV